MKKCTIILYSAIVLLMSVTVVYAAGTGTNMGYLNTVVTDGPFDAMRNPALLTMLKSPMAVGAEGILTVHESYDLSGSGMYNTNAIAISYDDPDVTEWEGALVFAMKLGNNAVLGIGASHERNAETAKSLMNIPALTYSSTTETDESTDASNAYLSLGYRLMPALSLGVGLRAGYLKKEEEESEIGGGDTKLTNDDRTSMLYSGNIGLLYTMNDMQVGFTFTTGTYSRQKQDYSKTATGSATYSINGEVSYTGRYSEAPAFILGFSRIISPLLTIGVEGGLGLGRTFDNRIATEANNAIEVVNVETEMDPSYFIAGGVALHLNDQMILGAGIRYSAMKQTEKKVTSTSREENVFESSNIMVTLGLEYEISSATRFVVFGAYRHANYDITNTNTEFAGDVIVVDMERKISSFDAGIGFIQNF